MAYGNVELVRICHHQHDHSLSKWWVIGSPNESFLRQHYLMLPLRPRWLGTKCSLQRQLGEDTAGVQTSFVSSPVPLLMSIIFLHEENQCGSHLVGFERRV